MSAPLLAENQPSTQLKVGTALVTEGVAAQERKIEEAGDALAEAKLRLTGVNAVFDDAQARYFTARKIWLSQMDALHGAQSAVTTAQSLLDKLVHDREIIRAPPHPVRRTPVEVLGLIFEFCVDLDLSQKGGTAFRRQPFVLARICSHWRRVALLHPRVWANIDIRLDIIKTETFRAWHEYVSTMLSRAGKGSLKLRFSRTREGQSFETAYFVKVLLPELQRCHSLHLDLHRVDKTDSALPLLQAEFPSLHHLRFDVWVPGDSTHHLTRILRHTPVLRSFTGRFPFRRGTLYMPQLVTASVEHCTVESAYALLEAASSLKTLTLHTDVWPTDAIPPLNYVSRIETLAIVCDWSTDTHMADFARGARLTALTSLSLSGKRNGAKGRMTFFAHAAEHMGSTLTRLHVEFNDGFSVYLHLFFTGLSLCSNLASFKLDAHFKIQSELAEVCQFLGAPSEDASGTWVCPKLQTLDLGGCTLAKDCEQGVVSAFLEQRLEATNDTIAISLRPKQITDMMHPVQLP